MFACNKCSVELVVGENWTKGRKKHSNYLCSPCHRHQSYKWYENNKQHFYKLQKNWVKNNPEKHKLIRENYRKNNPKKYRQIYSKSAKKFRLSEGVGVYLVMHGDIKLYVGEGQVAGRRNNHLRDKFSNSNKSLVAKYKEENNLSADDFTMFMIYECEDEAKRKERETHYRRELKPYLKPLD